MNVRTLAVAVVAALSFGGVPAAHAANAGVVEVIGGGTYTPGIGLVPAAQVISISVTNAPTVAASGGLGADNCAFSGSGLADSIAEGVGVLSGSCTGRWNASFPLCTYVRVGLVMSVVCAGVIEVAHADLVLTPVALNPTTGFAVVGALAGAQ